MLKALSENRRFYAETVELGGSANFMTNAPGRFEQFSINFPMHNGNDPVVTAAGDTFSVSGMFASMGSGGLSAVDGNISVNCEF